MRIHPTQFLPNNWFRLYLEVLRKKECSRSHYLPLIYMDIEAFQHFCKKLPGAEMCFPFDELYMVFKVGGKMFALAPIEPFERINLKCAPERALELRAQYPAVKPGFHMNKRHWNSVYLDGSLTRGTIYEMIQHSYEQVVAQLSKKQRVLLGV